MMRCNLQPTKPETPGQTPSLNDKCTDTTGFIYVHYTTRVSSSFGPIKYNQHLFTSTFIYKYKGPSNSNQFLLVAKLLCIVIILYEFVQ